MRVDLEDEDEDEPRTPAQPALAGPGWCGLHLPEPYGARHGLLKLCGVLE